MRKSFPTKHLQREDRKMADNVSFKVYLKDPEGEETRRFVVDKEGKISRYTQPMNTMV